MANHSVSCFTCGLFVIVLSVVCIFSEAAVIPRSVREDILNQNRRRRDQDCYDKRILLCGPKDAACNNLFTPLPNHFATTLHQHRDITIDTRKNGRNYDVHAFRLCGEDTGQSITLAKAESSGMKCPLPQEFNYRSTRFRTIIEFVGCGEFFNSGSPQDLEIYAFTTSSSCSGSLKYRFLLINTTSRDLTLFLS